MNAIDYQKTVQEHVSGQPGTPPSFPLDLFRRCALRDSGRLFDAACDLAEQLLGHRKLRCTVEADRLTFYAA